MNSSSMLINGQMVNTPEQDPVINPALGEAFATCARATTAHVNDAVEAAALAFKAWRKDEAFRRQKLSECAAALQGRAPEIGQLLSQEQGKPLTAATVEVFDAAMWFSYYAGLQIEPEILSDDAEKTIQVVRKPLGVVAAITAWNFPVSLLSWKFAPALLAGNTVVAKPSPFTPLSSLMIGEIFREILPPGVVNFITGAGELGAVLAQHPHVRKISFTGSVATGKKIMGYAVEDLKRVTLELGGNDPAIVLDDVNPDAVIDGLFWGAFTNTGQVCCAIKRLYVHEDVYERIVAGLVDRAKTTKIGNGLEPDVQLGPINNQMQLEKVMGMVEKARKDGARVETGGARLESKGYFYPPTIVTDAHAGMTLVDDEQFGPALPIIKYKHLDAALEQANRTHYGLGASVWSGDVKRAQAVVQQIDAGTGWVNQHGDITPYAPFGGSKWSGIGYENGKWGYDEFTELQVVNTRK